MEHSEPGDGDDSVASSPVQGRGKDKAVCRCPPGGFDYRCVPCSHERGTKLARSESDQDWLSPSRDEVLRSVSTPKSGSSHGRAGITTEEESGSEEDFAASNAAKLPPLRGAAPQFNPQQFMPQLANSAALEQELDDADAAAPAAAAAALLLADGPSHGSSVLTTPKFAGQTSPASGLDYSPTRATGKELEDRKRGLFKRPRAGDDDNAY